MKRKSLSLLFAILFVSSIFLGACTPQRPYIKVVGLKTEYYVGDELDLSSAKIRYFKHGGDTEYIEEDLTIDMISNFSTEEVGNFTITVTYQNFTTTVKYSVKVKPTPISESTASIIISQTIENMSSQSEVKQTTTTKMFGYTETSYVITTQNKQYSYYDKYDRSWITKENNSLKLYEIYEDVFEETINYMVYDLIVEHNNLIKNQYSNLVSDSILGDMDFVDAYVSGSQYTITYFIENLNETYIEMIIEDNLLKSETTYNIDEGKKKSYCTVKYSYNKGEINSIPSIPNKNWTYGGEYYQQ